MSRTMVENKFFTFHKFAMAYQAESLLKVSQQTYTF